MNKDSTIIENINENAKCLKVSSLKEFKQFMFLTKTEQADKIMNQLRDYLVVSDKLIYYYNENKKLWVQVDEKQYDKLLYDFLLNSTKHIKKLIDKEKTKLDLNDLDEFKKDSDKIFDFLSKKFDEERYIATIIKRSSTLLYDSNFVSLLDSSKECFPIKNGKKINFKTLEISNRTNLDYFSYESPVEYVENTPNADKFFKQLFEKTENIEYVRKVFGYNLTAETFIQQFYVWYGFGSNGKSLVAKLFELILCKQFCMCDDGIFVKNRKTQGQATPELMALMGKRIGFYSEGETADNVDMNEGTIKRISGEDKITGRYLFSNQVEFYPYVKLNMGTNFVPYFGADQAMIRRLKYIFFDYKFVAEPKKPNERKIDLDFTDKLKTEYLSEVFSWMAKGAFNLYKTKEIIMPEEYQLKTKKLLEEGDSIECFIKRKIVKSDNYEDTMKKNDLFDAYKTFCNQNSQRCIARSTLWARISQLGINTRILHGCDVFFGISINDSNQEESEYKFGKNPLDYGVNTTDYKTLYEEEKKNSEKYYNDMIEEVDKSSILENENKRYIAEIKKLKTELYEITMKLKKEQNENYNLTMKNENLIHSSPDIKEESKNYDTYYIDSKQILPSVGKKIYIHLPYRYKDKAKKYGARFDKDFKQWYVIEGSPDANMLIDAFKESNFDKSGKFVDVAYIDETGERKKDPEWFTIFAYDDYKEDIENRREKEALERIKIKKNKAKKVAEITDEDLEAELLRLSK